MRREEILEIRAVLNKTDTKKERERKDQLRPGSSKR